MSRVTDRQASTCDIADWRTTGGRTAASRSWTIHGAQRNWFEIDQGADDQIERVSCEQPHRFEAVATLKGENSEEQCRREAEQFLGGPMEESRARYITLKYTDPMRGGMLCAVAETTGTDGAVKYSTRTLKDGLRGIRPLAITCVSGDPGDDVEYTPCDEAHSGEFVGIGADDDCSAKAAAYLGLTPNAFGARGDIELHQSEGDHPTCYVFEAEDPTGRHDTLVDTLKGLGTAALPHA